MKMRILGRFGAGLICVNLLTLLGGASASDRNVFSPELERVLDQTNNPVPVVVVLKPVAYLPEAFALELTASQKERLIKSRAARSQSEIKAYVNQMVSVPTLQGEVSPMRRILFLWGTNGFMATATPDVIEELASFENVERIFLDRKIKLAPLNGEMVDGINEEYTYGLEKIGVPEVRSMMPELNGRGVRVGIIDTGIDAAHPELRNKTKAWRDFTPDVKDKPYDDNGHGTHVAGTIAGSGVGGTQIGVAPGADLIIAKVFTRGGSATLSGILRAMEWVANPDGNPDTNDRPHVVNNSWGGGPSADVSKDPFNQAVVTWVQLGIFPSFAAGNSGPSAETVGSPGCLPSAFAVGATDDSDRAASFSSRGPVNIIVDGKRQRLVKPEISAPGVAVVSSMPGGRYAKLSGTSMATPHVTGAIALLYQLRPTLNIAEMRSILLNTAKDLGGDGHDTTFGAGRLNLVNAVRSIDSFDFGFED
jgi:subtilisin family serine protease